jgi:hypothetical protein
MKRHSAITVLLVLSAFCIGCQRSGLPEYQGKSLKYWETQAADKDVVKRREAAQALGRIGMKGLPGLAKLLGDEDQQTQNAASLAIIRLGQKALPELKRLTHSPIVGRYGPKGCAGAD